MLYRSVHDNHYRTKFRTHFCIAFTYWRDILSKYRTGKALPHLSLGKLEDNVNTIQAFNTNAVEFNIACLVAKGGPYSLSDLNYNRPRSIANSPLAFCILLITDYIKIRLPRDSTAYTEIKSLPIDGTYRHTVTILTWHRIYKALFGGIFRIIKVSTFVHDWVRLWANGLIISVFKMKWFDFGTRARHPTMTTSP